MLKETCEVLCKLFPAICLRLWKGGSVPRDWFDAVIASYSGKGVNNEYGDVNLLRISGKV